MSSLVLIKAFACLVVIYWSLWISVAEHSHSRFALVLSRVQVRICFLFPMMPTRVVSGRSKLLTVGLCTRILRLRVSMDDILFSGEENVLNVRETAFTNSVLSFEASFGALTFCKLKT
jgi:hypothetical protein